MIHLFALAHPPRRPAVSARRLALRFLTGAVVGLLAGCQSSGLPRVVLQRPPARTAAYVPTNYTPAAAIPLSIRRVAVLPLYGEGWRNTELAPLDDVLREAFSRTERFEVVAVSREDLAKRFGQEAMASSSALPADLLPRLQADLGVDAVLLLDLTHYAPYQPVALGVRARLVTVEQGDSLWAFDSIFDAARADVSLAARRFSNGRKKPPAETEDTTGVLQSPVRFARYVGAAMFESLPPRRTE